MGIIFLNYQVLIFSIHALSFDRRCTPFFFFRLQKTLGLQIRFRYQQMKTFTLKLVLY